MKEKKSKLEDALNTAELMQPGRLPQILPVGHVGYAENLVSILTAEKLEPRHCTVMQKKTLYLFYGGIAYRASIKPTLQRKKYPIAFIFHPHILASQDVHYPFDTGAMAAGIYGPTGSNFKNFKNDFRVTKTGLSAAKKAVDVPQLIVKHLFGDNGAYSAGRPRSEAHGQSEPIPQILDFIFSRKGDADHRRACIETQKYSDLSLNKGLLWMGYPDIFETEVQEFLRKHPQYVALNRWAYPAYARYKPSDVCARLDGRASAVLDQFFQG